jgi:hypothetical protein
MTDLSRTVVMAGQFGLDPDGRLYVDSPTGPEPMKPVEHVAANWTGVHALVWTLALADKHKALTVAQKAALENPAKPGLRCLPALEAKGLVKGTERTELGELVLRMARKFTEKEAGR